MIFMKNIYFTLTINNNNNILTFLSVIISNYHIIEFLGTFGLFHF